MTSSAVNGNRPELWEKFLQALDERLQLGLLDHLNRLVSYHFEEDVLYIEPENQQDYEYLAHGAAFQQLQVLAQDVLKVDRVKVRPHAES